MKVTLVDINGTPHCYDRPVEKSPLKTRSVVAKQIHPEERNRAMYWVLASNDDELFNPNTVGADMNRQDRPGYVQARYVYNLRKCSEECYSSYVTYLRSKNATHFIVAQRRFSHGF